MKAAIKDKLVTATLPLRCLFFQPSYFDGMVYFVCIFDLVFGHCRTGFFLCRLVISLTESLLVVCSFDAKR